jgi:hypothetical protein
MSADNLLQKQQKQRGRPFEKGCSGNPAGRPRGVATTQPRPPSCAAEARQAPRSPARDGGDCGGGRMWGARSGPGS